MYQRALWKDEVAHLFIQRARWALPNSSSLKLLLTLNSHCKPALFLPFPILSSRALERTLISHRCPCAHRTGRTGILPDKRAFQGLHQIAPGKGRLSDAASSRPTMSDRWPAASGSEFNADESADRIRRQQ